MIAYCGLSCSDCPAYIATQKDDDDERRKVAEMWSKEFNHDFNLEDINCDGCLDGERVFHYCTICEIRKCAREKSIVNCAHCNEYVCEKLEKFFEMAPEAKKELEGIRKEL